MASHQERPLDEYQKLHNLKINLLEKFQNGYDLYNFNPLFRNMVEAVIRGRDQFEILEFLITENTRLIEQIIELHKNWPGVRIK